MKLPKIAQKTNGLTHLYSSRTKEKKNSLKMLLTTIGWIFPNSENRSKIRMVKANKSNRSKVLIRLDVSFSMTVVSKQLCRKSSYYGRICSWLTCKKDV